MFYRSDFLLSIPSSLSEQLRRQTDELRSKIVRTNYNTQFVQTTSKLAPFRDATTGIVDEIDDRTLSELFQKTVPLTTYDLYAPFIERFLEKPCKASATVDLLSPGLPDYLVRSSSTSGNIPKYFPRYNCLSKFTSPDTSSPVISAPLRRRSTAFIAYFWSNPMHIEDAKNDVVKTVYLSSVSVINRRTSFLLHPDQDKEKMATFILDHAAPHAVGFIKKLRSYLIMHALFALSSRSLETMTIPYTSTFVDMMRHLDSEFDMIVDCIANGTVPDLEGIAEVRHYLEVNMLPDPSRAAELHNLGRPSSRPGWCSHAWPSLRSVTTTASGAFARYLPLARWFLGPNVNILSRGYRCTEGVIALPYNPRELNQYKLDRGCVMELLDTSGDDSISALAQLWEAKVGKRYEVVLTTPDGLWRYRLGDVVEISGFDPTDGVPIIQFIERRNVLTRFPLCTISENELSSAMLSLAASIQVADWTATIDDRRAPATVGFFIELAGGQVSDLALAAEHLLDALSQINGNILYALGNETFGKPSIRIVQSGTFSDFRQLKLDEGGCYNLVQVKVPVVLPKTEYVTWFSNRVVQEL